MEAMRQKGALTQRLVQQRFKQYNTQRTDSHDGLLYRRVASDPRVEIAFKIGADSVQNKTDKASETPEQPAAENNSRNGVVVEASLNHPVSDEVKSFMETMKLSLSHTQNFPNGHRHPPLTPVTMRKPPLCKPNMSTNVKATKKTP